MHINRTKILSVFLAVALSACGIMSSSSVEDPAPVETPVETKPVTGAPGSSPATSPSSPEAPTPVVLPPGSVDPVPGAPTGVGPAGVMLGTAGSFAILSKAGVTNVSASAITGNVGTSPITGASIVGLDCVQVTGQFVTVDPAGSFPTCNTVDPVNLTTNIGDMEIAYADAAGRTSPDTVELGAGELGGLTIAPGLHKFSTTVLITTQLKLSGAANDVWIFQIAGNLTQANGIHVILEGGALAKNIFWQVAQDVTIGTSAVMHGNILGKKLIALNTGASLKGRALAQTEVTLQSTTVVKP